MERRHDMAKDEHNQGGPTHRPSDPPTEEHDFRKAQSRDEVKERSVEGERPGRGQRNGSAKRK
jgi:hypothetical protein